MEGLVHRFDAQGTEFRVDIERAKKNLHQNYQHLGETKADPTIYAGELGMVDSSAFADSDDGRRLVMNYAAAHSRLAIELIKEKRFEEALEEADYAALISPNYPGIMVIKGYILEELGRLDEALEHYQQMAEVYPNEWELPHRAGGTLMLESRYREAIPYFQRAAQLNPSHFEPVKGMLNCYYSLGDYQSAMQVLMDWNRRNPGDANVRNLIESMQRSLQDGSDPFAPDSTEALK